MMSHIEVTDELAKRPSVHRLCYGTYLQEPAWISENVLAVPLAPLGFNVETAYVAAYLRQFCSVELTDQEKQIAQQQGQNALPVISLVFYPASNAPPEQLEAIARPELERGEQILAWATGDRLTEFAWVTASDDRVYFRLVPPHSRRRMRLGFGNTGTDFKANIDRIRQAADEDPRFALAMALLADAAHEPNPLFKICRLFNVLESLAYALKGDRTSKGDKVGSRKAVKIMMGLEGDALANVHVGEHSISYDRIEISGRLRDKFFHGIPFSKADLNKEAQPAFHLIEHHPEIIADALQEDCEIAIARWANDASPARDAARKKASGK